MTKLTESSPPIAAALPEVLSLRSGVIFACGLADELFKRARAGDQDAWRQIRLLVGDVAPAKRREERTRRIQKLAERLHAALPHRRLGEIALLISLAGDRLLDKRELTGPIFGALAAPVLTDLRGTIAAILPWAPATRGATRWPCQRQIEILIKDLIPKS